MQRNTKKTTKEMQDEISAKFPNLILIGEYEQANKKMLIHCNDCGHEWEAIPRSVAHSVHGCPKCKVAKAKKDQAYKRFLSKINLNDWEVLEYKNHTNVTVACKKCGWVRTTTASNIQRFGCKRCSSIEANEDRRLTTEQFVERAKKIHGDKYNYSKVKYYNWNTPVEIICPIHGSFWQRPSKHLIGQNCPLCFESRGEEIIRLVLTKYNIPFEKEKQYKLYKNVYADYYINYNNKEYIIEMNGKQHYEPVDYFGGEEKFKEQIKRDLAFVDMCRNLNIKLFIIRYDENIVERTIDIIKQITAVSDEESLKLLSGNIGKSPEMDNTEINSEIAKGSESSYSVESE